MLERLRHRWRSRNDINWVTIDGFTFTNPMTAICALRDQIRDLEEEMRERLDTLEQPDDPDEPPLMAIVVDADGDAWQRKRFGWAMTGCEGETSWAKLNEEHGPITPINEAGLPF